MQNRYEINNTLYLFEIDRDYGLGMEFKRLRRIDLPPEARRFLSEHGHVRVHPQIELPPVGPSLQLDGEQSVPCVPIIEYRAVFWGPEPLIVGVYEA